MSGDGVRCMFVCFFGWLFCCLWLVGWLLACFLVCLLILNDFIGVISVIAGNADITKQHYVL